MDETSITQYISETFGDVQLTVAYGVTFFFHGPVRMFPFATLATNDDDYDRASNLDRPGVYRLKVGVNRATYRSLFGAAAPRLGPDPVYAPQSWVSVLNPGAATLETVQILLAEAYERLVGKHAKKRPGMFRCNPDNVRNTSRQGPSASVSWFLPPPGQHLLCRCTVRSRDHSALALPRV